MSLLERGLFRRAIEHRETIATVLMGCSALLTTWCAFESTKWGGIQSVSFAQASAARIESTRNELAANQTLQLDIATFLAWVEAIQQDMVTHDWQPGHAYVPDPKTVSGFLYNRFRKDFRPAITAWVASRPLINPHAEPTPFTMKEYKRPLADRAKEQADMADRKAKEGQDANQISDNYMLTTVIAALVVFFAGLSSQLALPANGLVMLLLAWLTFFICLVVLTHLPVTIL